MQLQIRGEAMDIFNQNPPNEETNDQVPPNLLNITEPLQGIFEEEKPSIAEKCIGKGVGVLSKTFLFIVFGIAVASLGILLIPFMRLVVEFSKWAYEFVGGIFP